MLFWVSLAGLVTLGWVLHYFIGVLGASLIVLLLGAVGWGAGQASRRSLQRTYPDLKAPDTQEAPSQEREQDCSAGRQTES